MLSRLLSAVLLLGPTFVSASAIPRASSVPSTVTLILPDGDVPLGSQVTAGLAGGALGIPFKFFGFTYNETIALLFPNGTEFTGIGVTNDFPGAMCNGEGDKDAFIEAFSPNTTVTGQ